MLGAMMSVLMSSGASLRWKLMMIGDSRRHMFVRALLRLAVSAYMLVCLSLYACA
jgi:hypothetical protein